MNASHPWWYVLQMRDVYKQKVLKVPLLEAENATLKGGLEQLEQEHVKQLNMHSAVEMELKDSKV
jgi:hypothetical protein